MILDTTAFEIAARLARALEAAAVPYAIGGAIAWGIAGVVIDRADAHRAEAEGAVLIGRYAGMRVDLFTPSIPFAWEAMRTRRRMIGPQGPAEYLSPEATAVFKLLFFRPKDVLDLEKLVAVQGAALDAAYVRRWMVDMMGEADERVIEWDRIVAAFRG